MSLHGVGKEAICLIHMPVNIKDIKRHKSRPDDLGGPEEAMPELIVMDGQDCYEVGDNCW